MIDLLEKQLASYGAASQDDRRNATREMLQLVTLYLLWRAKFFQVAAFQGGTCLRIVHGLDRFSEDLDFISLEPDPNFDWEPYVNDLKQGVLEYGLQLDMDLKQRPNSAVRTAYVEISAKDSRLISSSGNAELKIRLEIDTNPPAGSSYAYSYLDFPLDYEICHQDLPSNFALKLHALLCRSRVKGRDWYDFGWYIRQSIFPNLTHLQNALYQKGPWQEQDNLSVDVEWLQTVLKERVGEIDWKQAVEDVEIFLRPAEQPGLQLWSESFFSHKVDKLGDLAGS